MANDYSTFVCKNEAYPIIKKSLASKNKQLLYYIKRYIDFNHEVLYANGTYALIWRYDDENSEASILYECTGYTPSQYRQMIEDTKQLKGSWIHFKKPYWWAMINCIKYFVDTKNKDGITQMLVYLSCSMYATIHYKFYRGYPINTNIMDFTINNLNNRYDIKKLGSLIKVLYKISLGCHEKYASYFEDKNYCDRYIIEYMQNLFTRLNNFVKEIKIQFQKNKEAGYYLNYDSENTDPDNFHETDNQSYSLERYANKITNKITTSGMNENIAQSAAKLGGVSVNSVKETCKNVIEKNTEEIREFETLFLQQYLVIDKHPIETISSKNFIVYANKIYTKSNTLDPGVIRMKDLLDKWLKANCKKYCETQRVATLINFRKAIFFFFTLSAQAVMTNSY